MSEDMADDEQTAWTTDSTTGAKTLPLLYAVAHDGKKTEQITFRRPTLDDLEQAEEASLGVDRDLAMYARLSGCKPGLLEDVDLLDWDRLGNVYLDFSNGPGKDAPKWRTDDEGRKTLPLAYPIEHDGEPITEISFRRPKLRDRQLAGKKPRGGERDKTMYSHLSEQDPDMWPQLDLYDWDRLGEMYADFFTARAPGPS